jgi:hypothetical protein
LQQAVGVPLVTDAAAVVQRGRAEAVQGVARYYKYRLGWQNREQPYSHPKLTVVKYPSFEKTI